MERAHAFMTAILAYPVADCGEALVPLRESAGAAGVEVCFAGSRIAGGLDRQFYLREGLISSFLGVARDMAARGWVLRVEDGYRSRAMQRALTRKAGLFEAIVDRVRWECGGADPDAALLFRRLSVLVATIPKIGTHMSGSALDISVIDAATGQPVDRGAPYLEMSELTPMDSPFVPDAALANRAAITALMVRHGFVAYPFEFWHYSQGDAFDACLNGTGRPARYGAVDLAGPNGAVQPITDPLEPLISPRELARTAREPWTRRCPNPPPPDPDP
jgi:D-alanyl-D-alanine dipeptidase